MGIDEDGMPTRKHEETLKSVMFHDQTVDKWVVMKTGGNPKESLVIWEDDPVEAKIQAALNGYGRPLDYGDAVPVNNEEHLQLWNQAQKHVDKFHKEEVLPEFANKLGDMMKAEVADINPEVPDPEQLVANAQEITRGKGATLVYDSATNTYEMQMTPGQPGFLFDSAAEAQTFAQRNQISYQTLDQRLETPQAQQQQEQLAVQEKPATHVNKGVDLKKGWDYEVDKAKQSVAGITLDDMERMTREMEAKIAQLDQPRPAPTEKPIVRPEYQPGMSAAAEANIAMQRAFPTARESVDRQPKRGLAAGEQSKGKAAEISKSKGRGLRPPTPK